MVWMYLGCIIRQKVSQPLQSPSSPLRLTGESDSSQTGCLVLGIPLANNTRNGKDRAAHKAPVKIEETNSSNAQRTASDPTHRHSPNGSAANTNGTHHHSPLTHQLHRHSISHHPSENKDKPEPPARSTSTSTQKNEKPAPLGRKSSWVSSISSKFSSSSGSNAPPKSYNSEDPASRILDSVQYVLTRSPQRIEKVPC